MLSDQYVPLGPVEVERKVIRLIEYAPLNLRQSAELLLIYAGKKPATILEITDSWLYDGETYLVSPERIKEVSCFLDKISLPYKICGISVNYGEEPPHEEVAEIAVARDSCVRDELIRATRDGDELLQGLLYGYNDSGIAAYLDLLARYNGPIDESCPKNFFARHVFSQAFFHDEMENTAEKWHRITKRLSPRIYREIIEESMAYDPISNAAELFPGDCACA
jgi:hypothetical protein